MNLQLPKGWKAEGGELGVTELVALGAAGLGLLGGLLGVDVTLAGLLTVVPGGVTGGGVLAPLLGGLGGEGLAHLEVLGVAGPVVVAEAAGKGLGAGAQALGAGGVLAVPALVVLEDVAEVITGLHEDLGVSAIVGAVGGLAGGTIVLGVELGSEVARALEGVADAGGRTGAGLAASGGVGVDLDVAVLNAGA